MQTYSTKRDRLILSELHAAIEKLATAVDEHAPIAAALRRFANRLPEAEMLLSRRPAPMRDLLYRALDEGTIDAQRFDWLMLAENRAARARGNAAESL